MENLEMLVRRLCTYPNETPWLEFKHNNYNPEMIGKDISALANGATLDEKNCAYFVWGVHDVTHELVGTCENLQSLKKGNEELEGWLRRLLSRNADFEYHTVEMDNVTIGVMIIQCATQQPVTFQNTEFIRVGSYTKALMEYPMLRSKLWSRLHNLKFEEQPAMEGVELPNALRLLDYGVYFDLIGVPQPESADGIAHYLLEEGILVRQEDGLYTVTNMGAILFAKRMADFPKISRKAVRVIQYDGNNRLNMLKEDLNGKGYALGVSRQTMSNWENGKTYPDIVSVIKMSDLYAISLDHLLKEKEEIPMSNYIDYLEESTNTVKSQKKLSLTILLATYLGIWAFALIVFWFFISGSDAMGYSLVFLWIILPVATLVISLLIGKNDHWGKEKWLTPIAFGVMHMLAEYATFSVCNMVSISFARINIPNFELILVGAFFSVIGLGIGSLIRFIKSKVKKN